MAELATGKVVLVTGGGGGMGRAGAEIFAREGAAHVYVADILEDGTAETVDLVKQAGGSGTALHLDVTDEAGLVEPAGSADHVIPMSVGLKTQIGERRFRHVAVVLAQ